MNGSAKPIEFLGNSLSELRRFPVTARRRAGYELQQVQEGNDPDDWKAMKTQKTNQSDIALASKRYQDLAREMRR